MCLKATVPSGLLLLDFRFVLTWKNTVSLSPEACEVLPWLHALLEPGESVSKTVPTLPGFQLDLIKISTELPGFDQ